MPKVVPKDVEMTKPGSSMKYRVTYPDGQQKWMREKPGHKSEKWKEREKKRMLKRHPEISDFFKNLEPVINKYADGEASDADIEKVVRYFETTAGWNKARMVVRRLRRSEKVKYDKAEKGAQKEYYKKVLDALNVAVDFVARRSRDKRKKAFMERLLKIAGRIGEEQMSRISKIAKKIVGMDINDAMSELEDAEVRNTTTARIISEALAALRRNDVSKAHLLVSRMSPAMKATIPSYILEWLEQNSSKTSPTESWKVGVWRDIGTVFGGGNRVKWEYSSFMTFSEGTSNKFHYFAVVEVQKSDGSKEYVGGNAYGRIGAKAKVIEIARGSRGYVMSAVQSKEYEKQRKGYTRQ